MLSRHKHKPQNPPMPKKISILYSGLTDPYHSKMGGYDKITHINLPKKILLKERFCKFRWSNRVTHGILSCCFEVYGLILRYRYNIVHYFYGELTLLRYFPILKLKKNKSVITLHLNIEDKKNQPLESYLKFIRSFNGIIVLSSNHKKRLKEKYGIESSFIPHGFFQPVFSHEVCQDINGNTLNKEKINVIFVGKQYRDYNLLKKAIVNNLNNESIHFHLVGVAPDIFKTMQEYRNVSIYSRLNDNQYYSLISDCDYGFLPVLFATANNTLMEFQYLDLPSILPDTDGINDYAAPHPPNFFYKNYDELHSIFEKLTKPVKNQELSTFMKNNFDWDIIYKKLEEFYQSLSEPPRMN